MFAAEFALPATPDIYWPDITPGAGVDYAYDATDDVTISGATDPIVSATFATMPSGTGEAAATSLAANGTMITAWLSGGIPGRDYTHRLTFTTAGGRAYVKLIGQSCNAVLAANPVPAAVVAGFGTAMTWPT